MASRRHFSSAEEGNEEGSASFIALAARDFLAIEDEREEAAARENTRTLDALPGFFLCIHLISGACLLLALTLESPLFVPAALMLAGLVLADLLISIFCRRRPPSAWPPHLAVRFAALYAFSVGSAWCGLAALLGVEMASGSGLAALALAAGFLALLLGFLAFPAIVALAAASGVAAIVLLGGGLLDVCAAALLSASGVSLSVIRVRHSLGHLKKRMAIDWNAMRANRFWIFTHETTKRSLAVRYADIEAGRNPSNPYENIAGFEGLAGGAEGGPGPRGIRS